MTAQGNPRTIFRRAIEHGNLLVAEVTVREIGAVSLGEALELTALIAKQDRARSDRYRVRWFQRFLEQRNPSIDDAGLVASSLSALGGERHAEALALLRALIACSTISST
jgi:hypothetical protein